MQHEACEMHRATRELQRATRSMQRARCNMVIQHATCAMQRATWQVVDRALGGVLFVDEAYALVNSDKDSFGQVRVPRCPTRHGSVSRTARYRTPHRIPRGTVPIHPSRERRRHSSFVANEQEALDTLMKSMEDYRDELVVVLAGWVRRPKP